MRGNFPLAETLSAVNERISNFSPLPNDPIAGVERFTSPKTIRITGPPDPMGDPGKQTRMCLTYLANDGTDAFETFAMRLVSYLLTDGPASPMYRALIETNIGTDYAASTGYDDTARQTSFSVGLQGISSSQVDLSLAALGTKATPSVPELSERIRRYTSGIGASPTVITSPKNASEVASAVHFGTSALDENLDRAYVLLAEVIGGPDLDDPSKIKAGSDIFERTRTLVAGMASAGMSSLANAGHRYAVGVASKGLGPAAGLRERLGGLSSVVFLNRLMAAGDEGIKETLENMKSISRFLMESRSPIKAAVIAGRSAFPTNETGLEQFISSLKWASSGTGAGAITAEPSVFRNYHVPLPFTVNYTARVFQCVPYCHEDSTSLTVLAELMTSWFLHKEIREKGGAYGAFASNNAADGLFSLASYRDPPGAGVRTVDAYDRAVEWAAVIREKVDQK
ncbi:Presequence protease, mitochondrial, partial [Cladochytrium tenue]